MIVYGLSMKNDENDDFWRDMNGNIMNVVNLVYKTNMN